MDIQKKDLGKSQVEITITLTVEEMSPFVAQAIKDLGQEFKIDGFRPGKIPQDIIEKKVDRGLIWEKAANLAASKTLFKVITDEKIEALGSPEVNVVKIAPDNEFIFKAKISTMPAIKLGDYKNLKAKRQEVKTGDKEVGEALAELAKSRAKTKVTDKPAENGFELDVDFSLYEGSPVGGDATAGSLGRKIDEAKNHPIILGEKKFIPGFEEELVGAKTGDMREFELEFPQKYHEASLSGKKALFKVKINNVLEKELPQINDEFAKSLGTFENLAALKTQLQDNIKKEAEAKEEERYSSAILDEIMKKTELELPEVLVTSEVDNMLKEFEFGLVQQGSTLDAYFAATKRTKDDLRKEVVPLAEDRLKKSLILREIYLKENLKVSDDELNEEITKAKKAMEGYEHGTKHLETDRYREYVRENLAHRKVFEFLKRG